MKSKPTSVFNIQSPGNSPRRLRAAAFTMMELMVAISILVIVILSVGVTFNSASKSVSVSQATMDMMANVRAIQQQLEQDVRGMDKNGFLVIRQRLANPSMFTVNGGPSGPLFAEVTPHYDQISFMSYGNFPDRTGANTNTPFANSLVANAAHIWWGQLILERDGASKVNFNLPPYPSYFPVGQAQATPATVVGVLPTGVYIDPSNGLSLTKSSSDFALGRHAMLLMPAIPSSGYVGFSNLAWNAPPKIGVDGVSASVPSSRYDIVLQSPAQVMAQIIATRSPAIPFPEVDLLTYRFRALSSIYDETEIPSNFNVSPFAGGYFRTTPIVMRAITSFKVEWTDGQQYYGATYPSNDPRSGQPDPRVNQMKWYGMTDPSSGVSVNGVAYSVDNVYPAPGGYNGTGDQYIALFNDTNRPAWPKALRITFHIDSDKLSGGRDFTQVIQLPQ